MPQALPLAGGGGRQGEERIPAPISGIAGDVIFGQAYTAHSFSGKSDISHYWVSNSRETFPVTINPLNTRLTMLKSCPENGSVVMNHCVTVYRTMPTEA
jgi:hypothetical protein